MMVMFFWWCVARVKVLRGFVVLRFGVGIVQVLVVC